MTQTIEREAPADSAQSRVQAWLADFDTALQAGDVQRAADLFAPTSFWRDLVAFSWNIVTVEGPDGVADLLRSTLADVAPTGWRTSEEATGADGVDTAWIEFETAVGRGSGLLRLTAEGAFTLLTTLDELKGHEEPLSTRRPKGVEHGSVRNRTTWLERREQESEAFATGTDPYALVIGGAQAGVALGARLRQLGVPTLIVEKGASAGSSWRSRYKSLALHDPVWYDHLPYLDFPKNWPVFAPKDKIAGWLDMYTEVMELTFWGHTEAKQATWDDAAGRWDVRLDRDGTEITLHPTHLVLATGVSGKPRLPDYPGMDVFAGEQHHSSRHPGADRYTDQRVVVVGSNNSAHDICAALWEVGAEVTMVQRSSTHIVRSESLMEVALKGLYSEEAVEAGMSTRKADMTFASLPYRIMHQFQIPVYEEIAKRDADFYARLEAAGFQLDWGDDGSGLFMKYLRRGSGYYIDVGASELVADGSIKLAHGQVDHLTADAVVLSDGTELPADVVVYATGYGSMNGWAADLIDQETADRVGKVWGLGSDTTKDPGPWEGEQRNMWKPTQVRNLWFHGGNLHQSRHYSLFLALQLKARFEGIPTPVYQLAEVHHTG